MGEASVSGRALFVAGSDTPALGVPQARLTELAMMHQQLNINT